MRPCGRFTLALALASTGFLISTIRAAERRDVFVQSRNVPAIAYDTTLGTDPVAQLLKRLKDGSAKLTYEADNGYLTSFLDALHIPRESQLLRAERRRCRGAYGHPGIGGTITHRPLSPLLLSGYRVYVSVHELRI